jgi:hypothetical protein
MRWAAWRRHRDGMPRGHVSEKPDCNDSRAYAQAQADAKTCSLHNVPVPPRRDAYVIQSRDLNPNLVIICE